MKTPNAASAGTNGALEINTEVLDRQARTVAAGLLSSIGQAIEAHESSLATLRGQEASLRQFLGQPAPIAGQPAPIMDRAEDPARDRVPARDRAIAETGAAVPGKRRYTRTARTARTASTARTARAVHTATAPAATPDAAAQSRAGKFRSDTLKFLGLVGNATAADIARATNVRSSGATIRLQGLRDKSLVRQLPNKQWALAVAKSGSATA